MRLGALLLAGCVLASSACYSAGDGTAPPLQSFYFPVGLTVSRGGNVLYAVNSDFDLQWNGGTLQSYDLHEIRRDVVRAIANPRDPRLPLINPSAGDCPGQLAGPDGTPQKIGQVCAPPTDSSVYVRDSAVIGAFATDLQLAQSGTRLFAPVRGDATITWADVAFDDPASSPAAGQPFAPFTIDCGARVDSRCDGPHHAGSNPDEAGNTRHITMPGEPFGMAQSEDGTSIVITHQTETLTSLFSTGFDAKGTKVGSPALQFVVGDMPVGGNGIVAVPHDPQAFASPAEAPRPSFLQTSRSVAELDLLRYYADDGVNGPSSIHRPFLVREQIFNLTANASGVDSRGIVIDPTARVACKVQVPPANPGAIPPRTQADVDADVQSCARLPARVFFANRAPASVLLGEIGEAAVSSDGPYDADRLKVFGNIPLSAGPSKLYLAPVVDADGNYALRLFIVCYDSSTIFVYDPDSGVMENIIRLPPGTGPFAMAFDPFVMDDVALRRPVAMDDRFPDLPAGSLRRYRFAYVASFINSHVLVIDLDDARDDKSTYEKVVYTLGQPTAPKGS